MKPTKIPRACQPVHGDDRHALPMRVGEGKGSEIEIDSLAVDAIHLGQVQTLQDLLPHLQASPLSIAVLAIYKGAQVHPATQACIDAVMACDTGAPNNWDEVVGLVQRGFSQADLLSEHAPVETLRQCTRRMPWLSRMKARLDAIDLQKSADGIPLKPASKPRL